MPPATAVVGRQPILDREEEVAGYELLFRPLPTSESADDPEAPDEFDSDQMTNEVIFSALGIGIERLTGGKDVYCNADRGVLTGRIPISLPPKQTVIEILETVEIDDEVIAGCRALKRGGYRLAADDFVWRDGVERMLELVDIVKIDVQAMSLDAVASLAERCRPYGAKLLAEKIETPRELAAARALEFDLYQGYHLGRPKTIVGHSLGASRLGVLRLSNVVLDDNVDFKKIEEILRGEPELTYQLLQLAAIGRFGETGRQVKGVRQALVWIGLNRLRGWIPALLLRPAGRAVDSNLPAVLGRARMVELLANRFYPEQSDLAFTAGMVSAFDLLLGVPPEKLSGMLELPPLIRQAAFDRDDPIGALVGIATDYETRGTVPIGSGLGIDRSLLAHTAARAFAWAMRSSSLIDRAA